MKKRSGASFSGLKQSPLEIFLDECVGTPLLADRLRALPGVTVEIHRDHFSEGEFDDVWIPSVAARGWVILTKDKEMRHRRLEIEAVRRNQAYWITFGSGNGSANQMAESFRIAHMKIRRETARWCGPFFGRITKTGDFAVL